MEIYDSKHNLAEKNGSRLVIISGPSGVGKSTICGEVVKRLDNVYLSVSCTTRQKAESEVEGREYFFISKEEFESRIKNDMLLEYAEVFGNYYGTPKDKVEQAFDEGRVVVLEIDVEGGKQVKQIYRQALMIFVLAPTQKDLVERINNRGREQSDAAEIRLQGAEAEIAAAWQYYKHMVINDDLEHAINEVLDLISSHIGESND